MIRRSAISLVVLSLVLCAPAVAQTQVPHNLTVAKDSDITAKDLKDQIASGDMVEVPKALDDPTHTYTHGPLSYSGNDAAFVTLDGNPADCGVGYCGLVQVRGGENPWWGLETPQVWLFPNGGFNVNNTVYPLSAGAFTLVAGSCVVPPGTDFLHTDGCSDTSTTAVTMIDYAAGETYTEVALYQVHKRLYCGHGVCRYAYTNDSVSGTGTTSYTTPQ